MKKLLLQAFLLCLVVAGFTVVDAAAQSSSIRGNWVFTLQSPMGPLPIGFSFKNKGKGTFTTPNGVFSLVFREKSTAFSIALEAPGLAPDGSDLTFIIRGTNSGNTLTGSAVIVSQTADTANPTGFTITVLPVAGTRQ
jgi:hypothetical protein